MGINQWYLGNSEWKELSVEPIELKDFEDNK